MKTNRFFGLAVIVCGAVLAMSSCTGNEDTPVNPDPQPQPQPQPEMVNATIGFEGAPLNADGIWHGDESGEKVDNFGSEAFACSYKEDIVNFPVTWTPAWASWSGFGASNRTETTFASETMAVDQFNNIRRFQPHGDHLCFRDDGCRPV